MLDPADVTNTAKRSQFAVMVNARVVDLFVNNDQSGILLIEG
jgi:hypothetical protein